MIDLHTHSTFSDGTLSPDELVKTAVQLEIGAIALTDHDEIAGNQFALAAAEELPVEVVPGVELSIDYDLPARGHLHLLGLFIDYRNSALGEALQTLRKARSRRASAIIKKLDEININLSEEELLRRAGHGSIGRPHIASMLLEQGFVTNLVEAFKRFLAKGRPAYVPKKKLPLSPAIQLIHQAGGLAILAHPVSLGCSTYKKLGDHIKKFKAIGLDGLEVFYPSHDRYFTKWLKDFARQENLLISGGSDFHGQTKPNIKLGRGYGNLRIPVSVFDTLHEAVSRGGRPQADR